MLIRVADIPPEGLRIQPEEALNVSGVRFEGRARADLRLTKVDDRVVVQGTVSARVYLVCGRCLDEFPHEVRGEFCVEYRPETSVPDKRGRSDHELTRSELDVVLYTGDTIDTRAVMAEQVLLGIPMGARCRDDCRGVCPTCGADLNREECACHRSVGDPRFAVLEQLRAPSKGGRT